MTKPTATETAPVITFTQGLPGSGKSTTLRRLGYTANATTIDPDAFKAQHPEYDPKNPGPLHAWSKQQAEAMFQSALTGGTGDWIVDGTGTNAEKIARRIDQAKAAGFRTRLVYVRVAVETAIARNASRARTVPQSLIEEKALDITTAHAICAPMAHEVVVVDND